MGFFEQVVSNVHQAEQNVSTAIDSASSSLNAVANTATNLQSSIPGATAALNEIQKGMNSIAQNAGNASAQIAQLGNSIKSMLEGFLGNLPSLPLENVASIKIAYMDNLSNEEEINITDPEGAYSKIRTYSKSGKDFQIKFNGLIAIPFQPLIDDTPTKQNIRQFLLQKAGLDVNGPYLNSDPVTITIIICLTICFIVFVLGVAMPLAVGSAMILAAIAIAIVYAVISGNYNLDIKTCPKVSLTGSGGGLSVPVAFENCLTAVFTHR